MKKFLVLSVLFSVMVLVGCQDDSVLSQQSQSIEKVKIADFVSLDTFNDDFIKEYDDSKSINIFKEAFQEAEEKNYDVENYDYNIELGLSDETNRELHLMKNDEQEIVLKYIGDSTDTYVISPQHSKELIELIY